jgi:galactose mutarotase-like enzyme
MNDMEVLSLENDFLSVRIMPSIGGKIVSLRSVRTGEEFLLPPVNAYNRVSSSAEFSQSDRGGFDECLPSVASCESMAGQPAVPDHGDLWRRPWQVDSQDGAIVLHAEATSRPLRLTRKASLKGASLVLDYELLNLSNKPTSWLWSAHPLLQVTPGDRILLPEDVTKVRVEYSANDICEKGTFIDWPVTNSPPDLSLDLSKVRERDGITAHKLYARVESGGWAALYRGAIKQGIVVQFDEKKLPFLGLWICLGAWPDSGVKKQYSVALEPTTSNYDSLAAAIENGTAPVLAPRGRSRWQLVIHLFGASEPIDFDRFRGSAKSRIRPNA